MDHGRSLNIRFKDDIEPIQGDTVYPLVSAGQKEKVKLDKVEKVEIAFSLSDLLLFIPRLIGQFFK